MTWFHVFSILCYNILVLYTHQVEDNIFHFLYVINVTWTVINISMYTMDGRRATNILQGYLVGNGQNCSHNFLCPSSGIKDGQTYGERWCSDIAYPLPTGGTRIFIFHWEGNSYLVAPYNSIRFYIAPIKWR